MPCKRSRIPGCLATSRESPNDGNHDQPPQNNVKNGRAEIPTFANARVASLRLVIHAHIGKPRVMETITIPSPSAFLNSPVLKPTTAPSVPATTATIATSTTTTTAFPPPAKRRKSNAAPKLQTNPQKKESGVVKAKQSKSRNGCITCKAKRLKCDEIKPSCQQCQKRNVECGGYKKDFKWRPFEEATFVNKAPPPPKAKPGSTTQSKPPDPVSARSPAASELSSPEAEDVDVTMQDRQDPLFTPTSPGPFPEMPELNLEMPTMFDMSTPPYMRELPRPRFDPDHVTSSLSSLFEDANNVFSLSPSSPRPSGSGQSPKLLDLLSPGSALNPRPSATTAPISIPPSLTVSPVTMSPMGDSFGMGMEMQDELGDDVEDIVREPPMSDLDMFMRSSSSSRVNSTPSSPRRHAEPFMSLYQQPQVQAGSPEMLMLRFDKQTCGILSVKDGPTENPWRTLIWPLARDSPALYHAIASMTAFHTSKEKPALRVDGMEHMRRSIRALATGIEKMRTDTALATTLVLAFSESWDQHISTGIEHLRGAKILVNQALISHKKRALTGDDLARLKFLCNTWVYMDVIARLTSVDEEKTPDFDHDSVVWPVLTSLPFASQSDINTELDPLMGCAATLFPLIGRVANLCKRVCKVETNSIAIVSQAIQLKEAVEQWVPPPSNAFERPEDPTCEIQNALQTAEAYRYATLLYLHQAVPEIPSLTSAQLAQKVLKLIASVSPSSRLVIVQIFPLLAAGCEAWSTDDRQWMEERWRIMVSRMWIGNLDRCWEVMKEVWARRDAYEKAKAEKENYRRPRAAAAMVHSESSKRRFEEEMALEEGFSFSDMLKGPGMGQPAQKHRPSGSFSGLQGRREEPVTEELDPELTVRGHIHWVGVMKDWDWESKSIDSLMALYRSIRNPYPMSQTNQPKS